MLDIKFVRANPEIVKENIRKKFQEDKLILVDEVLAMDEELRAAKTRGDELRASRNTLSREIGGLMKEGPDETAGWSAGKLYSEAKDSMNEGAWDKAAKLFEKLEARYPYGRYAQQAQLELGYVYWKAGEPGSATSRRLPSKACFARSSDRWTAR